MERQALAGRGNRAHWMGKAADKETLPAHSVIPLNESGFNSQWLECLGKREEWKDTE